MLLNLFARVDCGIDSTCNFIIALWCRENVTCLQRLEIHRNFLRTYNDMEVQPTLHKLTALDDIIRDIEPVASESIKSSFRLECAGTLTRVLWANRRLAVLVLHAKLAQLCLQDLFYTAARWLTFFIHSMRA